MLTVKLECRCSSVDIIGVYWTKEYNLKFHKKSIDGSGKGNMAPANGGTGELYGIVFTINKDDEQRLHDAEGYGHGYKKTEIEVISEKTNKPRPKNADERGDQGVEVDGYMQLNLKLFGGSRCTP